MQEHAWTLPIFVPLGTQSRKPFPGTFLPENLENFSQNFFFFFLANMDSKVGNWFHQPHPPTPKMGTLDFSKFGLSIKSWKLVSPPPPLKMGTLDFSKFGLSIKSWKLVSMNPPAPPKKWELWILANLDSASKVGNWFPRTPSPSPKIGTLDFNKLDSASKVGNWFPQSPLCPPLPPPPPPKMGNLDFSKFGLT